MSKTKQTEIDDTDVIGHFKGNLKDIPRLTTDILMKRTTNAELALFQNSNHTKIEEIDRLIIARTADNNRFSSIVAGKIKDLKTKLRELKDDIKSVQQSINDAKDNFQKISEDLNEEFNQKRQVILAESGDVESQLNHYAEWQRQSDAFKSHLSELKSTIHHNRVLCSEGIAETRQAAQAKIEKHRVHLAEAIRKARAESLRLRSGDISKLSTSFLTLSEAHLKSLDSQISASKHLSGVNQTINEDNYSIQREIDRLVRKNQTLKEQEEKQRTVISKLRQIQLEFQQKEQEEMEIRRNQEISERQMKKRQEEEVRAQKVTKPKEEFKLTQSQEAFITFLNECATSVRSILYDILCIKLEKPKTNHSERFEAPKLSSMISEIKDLVSRVHNSTKPLTAGTTRKSTLTPAAAYFAFSAPFDESDDFIETENWSFAKYIPYKPQSVIQQKKPRIIRVKTAGAKSSLT